MLVGYWDLVSSAFRAQVLVLFSCSSVKQGWLFLWFPLHIHGVTSDAWVQNQTPFFLVSVFRSKSQ